MEIEIVRRPACGDAIVGKLAVDGVFQCFSLERLGVEIPAGRYPVTITPSTRFGRMLPLITNVPGRVGIRIHSGNAPDDSSGCVLVGESSTVDSVVDSKLALAALQRQIAFALAHSHEVHITIQ